jgi:hypothetical protein
MGRVAAFHRSAQTGRGGIKMKKQPQFEADTAP